MRKIVSLIKESNALNSFQKEVFIRMTKLLSREKLQVLEEILNREKGRGEKIVEKTGSAKNGINKQYIEKMRAIFERGKKKAVKKEESEDKARGEKLLDQLNDL